MNPLLLKPEYLGCVLAGIGVGIAIGQWLVIRLGFTSGGLVPMVAILIAVGGLLTKSARTSAATGSEDAASTSGKPQRGESQ